MLVVNPLTIRKLKRLGVLMPADAVRAASAAKLPLADAVALLKMETGGGKNIYGHDPTIYCGYGAVTKKNYAAYKAMRKGTGKMQGVGPVQLTWFGYQDEADRLGGCHVPRVNMQVGFSVLRAHILKLGPEKGFAAYNGSGPAATAYGKKAAALAREAKLVLGAKAATARKVTTKPKKVVLNPRDWWKRWVYGDVDCERDLLVRLANVAKAHQAQTGKPTRIRVRQGRRTYAEQLALYRLYLSGKGNLAARPGTSNHETGHAADCGLVVSVREVNLGADNGVRRLMRKYGLCLPVAGENWHTERGSKWAA